MYELRCALLQVQDAQHLLMMRNDKSLSAGICERPADLLLGTVDHRFSRNAVTGKPVPQKGNGG
jgi:hypothetical protein